MKQWQYAVVVGLLGAGCAGTGEFEDPVNSQARQPAPAAPQVRSERSPTTEFADELASANRRNYVVQNYNLTLEVAEPGKAMGHARELATKIGCEVVNSDRQNEYASLTLVADRSTASRAFDSIRPLGKVTGESQTRNDMRAAVHELRQKVRRLNLATTVLQQAVRDSNERAVVDALVLQLQLNQRERDGAAQQLQSYDQQAVGDQLHINFSLREAVPGDKPR